MTILSHLPVCSVVQSSTVGHDDAHDVGAQLQDLDEGYDGDADPETELATDV